MSLTNPHTYAVIGDTDCWSTTLRGSLMSYDATMRTARLISGTAWQTICGVATRRAGAVPIYAELVARNWPNYMFGIVADSLVPSILGTWLAQTTNAVAIRSTFVYKDNAIPQTGLASFADNDRLGLKLYLDNGVAKVQFYRNGSPYGTAVTLTADVAFRIACSHTNADIDLTLVVDAPDMLYLPTDCQPWGAAARLCEAAKSNEGEAVIGGGVSPLPTRLTLVNAVGATIDAYQRTHTSTAAGWYGAAGSVSRYADRRFRAFEVVVEDTTYFLLGMVRAEAAVPAFPGATSTSWGFYPEDGKPYTNAAAGSATGATGIAVGDVWTWLWDGDAKVWLLKNGTVVGGGNPVAGTGAIITTISGLWFRPAVGTNGTSGTYGTGRVRIRTHAREMQFLPSYAEAWDGDLPLDAHYDGRLTEAPLIESSIYNALVWGTKPRGEAPSLNVINTDGACDALSGYLLRNQAATLHALDDAGVPVKKSTLLCDRADLVGEKVARIVLAPVTDRMRVRLDKPLLSLGTVAFVPLIARQDADKTYDLCQTCLCSFQNMFDGGGSVITWCRVPVSTNDPAQAFAVRRTVDPQRKHVVSELSTYYQTATVPLANGTLNAWTGGAPTSWTKTEVGTGAVTSAAGNTAARLQGGGNTSNYAAIHQQVTSGWSDGNSYPDGNRKIFIGINISANVSGDLEIALEEFPGAYPAAAMSQYSVSAARIVGAGTGWVWIPINDTSGMTLNYVSIYASRNAGAAVDITITDVTIVEARPTNVGTYVFEVLSGLASSAFANIQIAPYWSDKRPTLEEVLQVSTAAGFGDYFVDTAGIVTGVSFVFEPEAVLTSDANYRGTLNETHAAPDAEMEVADDNAPGLSDRVAYNMNFAPHSDSDFFGSIAPTTRAVLQATARENRLAVPGAGATEAKAFHAYYSAAVGAPPIQRHARGSTVTGNLYLNNLAYFGSTATNPATSGSDQRQIALHRGYAVRRRFYKREYEATAVAALRLVPGNVVTVVHPRFGLAGGKKLQLISLQQKLGDSRVLLTFWG